MHYLQWTSRGLSLLWAGFWAFFCIGSAFIASHSTREFLTDIATGLVFCAPALCAWRYELAGGLALVAAAVAAFLYFGVYARPFSVGLVLCAPPLLAGMLFLLHSWGVRSRVH